VFYDPTNAASATGKTIGHELIKTIGCPGRGLLDVPCKVPAPIDSDGDGVVDGKDKCPNTPAAVRSMRTVANSTAMVMAWSMVATSAQHAGRP